MSTSAIGMIIVVWGIILSATGYCFYKLLTSDRDLSS